MWDDQTPSEKNTQLWRFFRSSVLSLLLASQQLHAETALLPYKLDVFQFEFDRPDYRYEYDWYEDIVRDFLRARSREQVAAIARIQV